MNNKIISTWNSRQIYLQTQGFFLLLSIGLSAQQNYSLYQLFTKNLEPLTLSPPRVKCVFIQKKSANFSFSPITSAVPPPNSYSQCFSYSLESPSPLFLWLYPCLGKHHVSGLLFTLFEPLIGHDWMPALNPFHSMGPELLNLLVL